MQNTAVYAPVTFEKIVMIVINQNIICYSIVVCVNWEEERWEEQKTTGRVLVVHTVIVVVTIQMRYLVHTTVAW